MLQYKFKVPIYKQTIRVIALKKGDTFDKLSPILKRDHMGDYKILDGIEDKLTNDSYDGAECIHNKSRNHFIVLVYRQTSKEEFHTSLYHELYHVVYEIADSVDLEGEEALAYLAGYIYKEGTKIFTDEVINSLI